MVTVLQLHPLYITGVSLRRELLFDKSNVSSNCQSIYQDQMCINNSWLVSCKFNCINVNSHSYFMDIMIQQELGEFTVIKVGQYPSNIDVHGFDFEKYKKQLEKINAYQDYKKADLSYVDKFYVGHMHI